MGHPLTTAYTTLGPEGLQHSLDEPSVRMVFTNSALLGTLEKVVDQCPSLVWVIYDGEDTVDQVRKELPRSGSLLTFMDLQSLVQRLNDKLAARERPGRILSLAEVTELGKANMVTAEDGFGGRPARKDLYCIMVRH